MKTVRIFTDGAARRNPGPGGFGVVLIFGSHRKELAGGFEKTTNNRMELMAVIAGLEALKVPCEVEVVSDSKYVIDALNKNWIGRWKANGWSRRPPGVLRNADLWKRLDGARSPHEVTWKWVRGHAGHQENERCDLLATTAADSKDLPVDAGFLDERNGGTRQGDLTLGE